MDNLASLDYIYYKYAQRLRKHIDCVVEAGIGLGIGVRQLHQHDASKWEAEEFNAYALKFIGEVDNKDAFNAAWLHHIHRNPHHWQHWIIYPNEALMMPTDYAMEMIADWMGASLSYQGTLNMTPWLKENLGKVVLHPITAQFVGERLQSLGYKVEVVSLLKGWCE